ncbi:MAG TPA: HIT domain-containing protein [Pseudomonadales bacterium]|nr:HIT domain-containing protein [Pseudomonadales bacterium]
MSCVFCDIAAGRIGANLVYQDEHILAFHDRHPRAKVHVLVITRKHIASLAELSPEDSALIGHLTVKLKDIAGLLGLNDGFKTQINTGQAGGQEIPHIHYHVMSGRT